MSFVGEQIKEVSEIFYNLEVYDDDEQTVTELLKTIQKEKLQIQISTEKEPSKLRELLQRLTMLGEEK